MGGGDYTIREAQVKSVLRTRKRVDSWFISIQGMNLYRGCSHDCAYCDGRAEKYRVEGDFGSVVEVKVNAVDLLRRELDPARKRKPPRRAYLMIGGGVGDSYQPAEAEYNLTRRTLELALEFGYPVHLLTKSSLVTRDIDLVAEIHRRSGALVSFSLSSADDGISRMIEPGASPPSERLWALACFRERGIPGGVFLLPTIPFVTDTVPVLRDTLRRIREAGADYLLFGSMSLKEGRQREHFFRILSSHFPDALKEYDSIYRGDPWGSPSMRYAMAAQERFNACAADLGIARRIPACFFSHILGENDLVAVVLDQLGYLLQSAGRRSRYGYISYQVSGLEEPVSALPEGKGIKGAGHDEWQVIREILEDGTCRRYEELLRGNADDST
ncbi:MAG: radical SAM protein [Spirochaetes bacterium]|nr:radical SAM protein [Spirochaetota bacterium]